MTKRTVVIGLLGTTIDRGKGAAALGALAADGRGLSARGPAGRSLRAAASRSAFAALAETVRDDIRHVSPETEVRLVARSDRGPVGFRGGLRQPARLRARATAFDTDAEDYLVHITTGTHVAQICLFLLTESRHIPARLLQTSPPPATRGGDPGTFRIIDLDLSKYDRIATRFARDELDERSLLKSGIETRNAAFNELIERLERVAVRSSAPILLLGPTGAGKSLLARRIFELKKSAAPGQGPVRRGQLRHASAATRRCRRSSATSRAPSPARVRDRPGLLLSANDGVLFLDEIGELGLDEQAMLLRALEEKRFLPLGGDREVSSDFQLIAGTNRDLARRGAGRAGFARICSPASTCGRSACRRCRAPRGHRAEPRLRARAVPAPHRHGGDVQQGSARSSSWRSRRATQARWPGNFRDLNAADHAAGDAGAGRPDHGRSGQAPKSRT